MRRLLAYPLLAVIAVFPLRAQPAQILVPGQSWTLLGQGYQLTADSAVNKDGTVYFSDAHNNRIMKIDLEGRITTWTEESHGTHGSPSARMAGCTRASTIASGSSLFPKTVQNQWSPRGCKPITLPSPLVTGSISAMRPATKSGLWRPVTLASSLVPSIGRAVCAFLRIAPRSSSTPHERSGSGSFGSNRMAH